MITQKVYPDSLPRQIIRWFALFFFFIAIATPTVTRNHYLNAYLLIAVLGILWCFFPSSEKTRNSPNTFAALWIAATAPLLVALASMVATGPISAEDVDYLQIHAILLLIPVVATLFERCDGHINVLAVSLSSLVALSFLSAIIQAFEHGIMHRASGPRNHPIMFADITVAAAFVAAAAIQHLNFRFSARVAVTVALLLAALVVCVLAQTRGAFIYFPVGLTILGYLLWQPGLGRRFLVVTAVFGFATTLVIAGLYPIVEKRVSAALHDVSQTLHGDPDAGASPIGQRFEMWKAASVAFTGAPLLGIGPTGFRAFLEERAAQGKVHSAVAAAIAGTPHTHGHSTLLNTLATQGVLGVFALCAMLGGITYHLWASTSKAARHMWLMLVSAYIVFGLTDSVFYHKQTFEFFVIISAFIIGLSRTPQTSQQ